MTIPAIMKSLVAFFDDRSPLFWTIIGIVLVGLLGIIDYLTGYEISFSLFYLAPIAAVAWYASRKLGIFISILSALTWMLAELSSGQTYSQPVIYFWNTLIRLGFFMTRLHADLTDHMRQRNWPVTFSVGVVICATIPDSANELVDMADELMYIVKNSTKNDVRFSVYSGRQAHSVMA